MIDLQSPSRMRSVSFEQVSAKYRYNPITGGIYRKTTWRKFRAGMAAESKGRTRGYKTVSFQNMGLPAHRVAWLLMTGKWPEHEVDHINLVKDDNRWSNLREATRSQNNANKSMQTNCKSGFKGVVWATHAKKWRASICIKRKQKNLGYYDTREAANAAYMAAAREIYGEFARAA